MKSQTEKMLFSALLIVVAMNLVTLLTKVGVAQNNPSSAVGTFQAACLGNEAVCALIDTRSGEIVYSFHPNGRIYNQKYPQMK